MVADVKRRERLRDPVIRNWRGYKGGGGGKTERKGFAQSSVVNPERGRQGKGEGKRQGYKKRKKGDSPLGNAIPYRLDQGP